MTHVVCRAIVWQTDCLECLARFIVIRAKLLIALTLLITLVVPFSFFRARIDVSVLSLLEIGEEYVDFYHHLTYKYGGTEVLQVIVRSEESILAEQNLNQFVDFLESLRQIEGIQQISSFLSGLQHLKSQEQLERAIAMRPSAQRMLLSADRLTAAITLRLQADTESGGVLAALLSVKDHPSFDISITGNEVIISTLMGYLRIVYSVIPPIALLVLVFVFFLNVRRMVLTIVALLPASIGALWMIQTVFWSNTPLEMVLVVAPIFVLVMGSADGLHFVLHYQRIAPDAIEVHILIKTTLQQVGIPMLLTTVTTMIGFLSLCISSIHSLKILGVFTALGIGYAGLASFFFLPAILSILYKRDLSHDRAPRPILQPRFWNVVASKKRHIWFAPVFFLLLTLVSLFLIPKVQVYSDLLLFFKKGSEIRKTFRHAEDSIGASQPIIGEFILSSGMEDSEYLEELLLVEREIEKMPGIVSVFSVIDGLVSLHKSVFGREGIPPPSVIRLLLRRIPGSEFLFSDDGVLFFAVTRDWTTDTFDALVKYTSSRPQIRSVTGMPVLFSRLNQLVVSTQFRSLLLTISGLLLVLLLVMREIKATLVSMIPIVVTVATIYGFLYVSGFHLNMLTATVSSIAIGVCIDYAIHLVYSIRYFQKRGAQYYTTEALRSAGPPILANALGICSGIMVLVFSPLLIHLQIATVLVWAMLLSAICSIFVIPVFYRRGLRD